MKNTPKYVTHDKIKPSFAEELIIQKFKNNNVRYLREVEFEGCFNPETGCGLRYDFFLPSKNLIIEYDGKAAHCKPEQRRKDRIKNKFAFDQGITLVRISGIANIQSIRTN